VVENFLDATHTHFVHAGQIRSETAYITPLDESRQQAQVVVATAPGSWPGWLKRWVLSPFLSTALRQDARILRLQAENIERFGGERFVSSELDLLRSHVLKLLESGPTHQPTRRQINCEI
jgi:hypothetical protein